MNRLIFAALLLGGLAISTSPLSAQIQNAGIDVDASGVLRMKSVADPTGQLTQQRLRESRAALDPNLARPSRLRKISLTRLEQAVRDSMENNAGLTEEMRYLAGLTRIQYVFVYPRSGDVVIAGPAEGFGLNLVGQPVGLTTGRSILELQDLIVALRCFPPDGQVTDSIGCSIDPTSEGLQQMHQFLASVAGRVVPGDAEQIAVGLRQSLGPQMVSISGVSDATHFARVLVEADYRMKLIGIGLESPPVRIVSYVQRANPANVSRNALQRWYFVPDYESVRMSDDGLAMELVGKGVKLIGEQEYVSQGGNRAAAGIQDRASQIFVRSFTEKYAALARKVPVFAQLRNLIDMSVVAAYLQERDAYGQAGWTMDLFGSESALPVETYEVPRQVESAVNVVWKRNVLMTPIGGGIKVEPKLALDSQHVGDDAEGTISAARETVNIAELAEGQWWWD
jgi:hypothetical protein